MRLNAIKIKIIPKVVYGILFALAGVLQYIDNDLTIFWDKTCSLVVNIIFFLLIFIWANSIKNRIIQKETRRLIITIAVLMFMWLFVRYVKYYFFKSYETTSRYLWYLYYIPQCLASPLILLAAINITQKTNYIINKFLYLILVPAFILIILILTNDLHQMAFIFKDNFENFDSEYRHGVLYYITMGWILLVMLIAIITLFLKCSISACKRKIWFPVMVFSICIILSFLCYSISARSYKVPELFCFSFILIFESCIWIGLIPSNKNYEKYFAISSISSIITDENLNLVFNTKKLIKIDKIFYERVQKEEDIFLDKNTRLSCKKISGGNVFYTENLSAINELLVKLSNVNEQLTEEVELITYENELKERKTKIEQKNLLYNKIFNLVSSSLGDVNELVESIDETSKDYEKKMRLACVYLSYIKRRSNLEMIANQSEIIDINEIVLSVKESLGYLIDYGIVATYVGNVRGKCDAKIGILLYEFFELCIKNSMPTLSSLIVNFSSKKEKISIRMIMEDAKDSIKDFLNEEIRIFNGKITITKEDNCLYQTLTFEEGGAKI